jgi:hypothetical protein
MKVKTSELTGPALDWAVAKCEGDVWLFEVLDGTSPPGASYSTDWSQGGPIIDRWGIDVHPAVERPELGAFCASIGFAGMESDYPDDFQYGPTRLIAAMRCFCCSKLGDEVDVPEELT